MNLIKACRYPALLFLSSLLTACGYHIGHEDSLLLQRSISVPYVEGDLQGELTAALIQELTATGKFDYCRDEGALTLQVRLVERKENNIGFRYYRNHQNRRTHSLIPTETRLQAIAEVSVIDNCSDTVIMGPVSITASIDFDHDYYSSRNAVNIYSLGQVSDYDAAYEAAFTPLNRMLAHKIANYLKDCW